MFAAGLSPDSRIVALALAFIFADPVTGQGLVLQCTSGFVKCLYGTFVCEPGRIVCRDGELVCADRLSENVCDLRLLDTKKPPDMTVAPEHPITGEDATSTAGPTDMTSRSTTLFGLAPGSRKYKLVPLWSWPSPVRWPTTEWVHSEKTFPPEHPTVSEVVSQEETPSSDSSSTLTESEVPPGRDVSGNDTANPSQPETSPITEMTSRSTTLFGLAPGSRKYKLVPLWSWPSPVRWPTTEWVHSEKTFPPEHPMGGENATSTASPRDVIGASTPTIGLAPGSRKYKLVPLWSWPSPVRWPTTEWVHSEKTFPPEHPTGGEDATSTASPTDVIDASTPTIGLAPGSRKYKLVPLWSWPTLARWPTTERVPPEKTFPPEHPTVSEVVSQEETPSSDSSSTLTESEFPPGRDVSGNDTAKPSQPETSPITDMTSRSTTVFGLAPGSRKYKLVPLWSLGPTVSRASTEQTHSSSLVGDRTTSPGQGSSTESSSATEGEGGTPVHSTDYSHPSSPEPPETETSPEGIQPGPTSPSGGPEGTASGHSTHGTVGTGHPPSQPFPTRRLTNSTRPRPPCSLTPKDTDIIRDMQARFLRLFVTSISSRGLKLVDTIFSYKDSQRHGVEVTATSVAGQFNGNKPEVSVLWRRYTRNYNELFLEVRILVKKLGEVHAKIQFRDNDGTISGLNPVVVLLGEATYLATITVLRDSGVGYGFSLKSEKINIDDYVMSKDADHASLKKIGTRSVNQLVRRMIRTRLVEISLVNLLSNPWRNLCIPSVSAQCTAE